MNQLVELDNSKHANLKVKNNCAIELAKTQHTLNLRVIELSKAACNFPVFLTRVDQTDDWAISAITSFVVDTNLFIKNDQWDASYYPSFLQTYPIFIMQKPGDERNYTLGIDEESSAFTQDGKDAEDLFDDKGNASTRLSRVKTILEHDLENVVHSFQFLDEIAKYDLQKSLDIQVHYANGKVSVLKGLHTIDEVKLRDLPQEAIFGLHQKGYLPPLYSMLSSLYQLNSLIRKHNDLQGSVKINQVKMEIAKDTP